VTLKEVVAIIVSSDRHRHGFQQCGLLRGQVLPAFGHHVSNGRNHAAVLFLGPGGFDDSVNLCHFMIPPLQRHSVSCVARSRGQHLPGADGFG